MVNTGRLEEARHACESQMRMQGPSVDSYLLLALISDAQGDGAAAAAHYRRVLYLDPNHGEALDHLALLMRKQGDDTGARRLADRARRQGGEPPDGTHCPDHSG
jgi:chemotaxis protein methyltransferase WspC